MKDRDLELWEYWVKPYYMFLMNGRWFQESKDLSQPHFVKIVNPVLANVNDSIIEELIVYRNWRHRTVGCWFAGIKKRSQYIEEISKALGGYYRQIATCFALVSFNNDLSIYYLSQYLAKFISSKNNLKDDFWKDHHFGWAIQALTYLDRQQGDFYFQQYYLLKNSFNHNHSDIVYLKDEQLIFKRIMDFCQVYFWS